MDRVLPNSQEAERAVIAAALLDPSFAKRISYDMDTDDFYSERPKELFRGMQALIAGGETVDSISLTAYMQSNDLYGLGGWASTISGIINELPFIPNPENYIKIVKSKRLLRDIAMAGIAVAEAGYDGKDADKALDTARSKILGLVSGGSGRLAPLEGVLRNAFDSLEKRADAKGRLAGVSTGFSKIDATLVGLQRGDLVIIAARPGIGKTAMALNIAANAAIRSGISTLISSLEMSSEQLAQRIISSEATVNGQNLRTGELKDEDWERVAHVINKMKNAPIYIDDNPSATVADIRSSALKTKAERGLGLIIVDYLQLINSKGRVENRQQEVAEITRGLKALARELEVPVVCLAQVSRLADQSQDKIPKLSHLKESGEIEQAADVVMFIHRETDEKKLEDDPSLKRKVTIIIAKQRNGPVGEFELGWHREFVKYVDIE